MDDTPRNVAHQVSRVECDEDSVPSKRNVTKAKNTLEKRARSVDIIECSEVGLT